MTLRATWCSTVRNLIHIQIFDSGNDYVLVSLKRIRVSEVELTFLSTIDHCCAITYCQTLFQFITCKVSD
jgi:hypothetical protein